MDDDEQFCVGGIELPIDVEERAESATTSSSTCEEFLDPYLSQQHEQYQYNQTGGGGLSKVVIPPEGFISGTRQHGSSTEHLLYQHGTTGDSISGKTTGNGHGAVALKLNHNAQHGGSRSSNNAGFSFLVETTSSHGGIASSDHSSPEQQHLLVTPSKGSPNFLLEQELKRMLSTERTGGGEDLSQANQPQSPKLLELPPHDVVLDHVIQKRDADTEFDAALCLDIFGAIPDHIKTGDITASKMRTLLQPSDKNAIAELPTSPTEEEVSEEQQFLFQNALLFLDYDGTLREFEDDPLAAVPTDNLNYLLQVLCSLRERLKVVIISGRSADFLENYIGKQHQAITLVAEHGFQVRHAYEGEWEYNHHHFQQHANTTTSASLDINHNSSVLGEGGHPAAPQSQQGEQQDWREGVYEQMKKLSHVVGSFVEEKTKSLVWHYRACKPGDGEEGVEMLLQLLELSGFPMERVSRGNKMIEVFGPGGPSKGSCMRSLIQKFWADLTTSPSSKKNKKRSVVFCAGDDVTDETMFELRADSIFQQGSNQNVLPPKFVSVKVGPGKSCAKYRVETPADVRSLLFALFHRLRGEEQAKNLMKMDNAANNANHGNNNISFSINNGNAGNKNNLGNPNNNPLQHANTLWATTSTKPTLDSIFGATKSMSNDDLN
ncbi:unnamed protein product [Amoebophrya sp. A25]|nr:unnamed protein product [Amoebophrya sp. A25]|eukprot:GSA25T00010102001.1